MREAGALGIMTSYNRLNGPYCSEHVELLQEILRAEWGFEGFVVSDSFGAASSVDSTPCGPRPRDARAGDAPTAHLSPTRCARVTSTKPTSTRS